MAPDCRYCCRPMLATGRFTKVIDGHELVFAGYQCQRCRCRRWLKTRDEGPEAVAPAMAPDNREDTVAHSFAS